MNSPLLVALSAVTMFVAGIPATGYANSKIEQLQDLSDAFAEVAARAKPGVVALMTERKVSVDNPYSGTPFRFHFDGPRGRQPGEREYQQGQGSGVIVRYNQESYVLTNNHVVKGAEKIRVEMTDGRSFEATVLGTDPKTDIAVLRPNIDDLPAVPLGDSDQVRVGEWVLAIGNPFGLEHTVTSGIISALGRQNGLLLRQQGYEDFIQTDAAINPGNSGGALINLKGELVGINTAIVSGTGGYQGIGFAVPTNMVSHVMENLIEYGEVRRGLLGVMIKDLDDEIAQAMGARKGAGVLIDQVIEDGPADDARLEHGDIILEVDGRSMPSAAALRNHISQTKPGTKVELLILRDGKQSRYQVVLGQLESKTKVAANDPPPKRIARLGLEVQTLNRELADRLGYEGEQGVIVTHVERGSPAERKGLKGGDLIIEISRTPVADLTEYEDAIDDVEPGEVVLLRRLRSGRTSYIALRVPTD
jgi:serine protease Do